MATTIEQVWEAFHVSLHQFIRRRISAEGIAEDLVQKVFLKIFFITRVACERGIAQRLLFA